MRLHFDLALVQRLLDHSKASLERKPAFEQLYEGRFRWDSKVTDLDRLTGGNFPTLEDVDPAKIPPGLWLVGDEGIYLLSNGSPALLVDPADSRNVVAYAAEANPAAGVDGWWETKRSAFGGDDGVVFLELRFVEGMIERSRQGQVCMALSPEKVEAVAPHGPRPCALLASSPPRRRTASRHARGA